MKDEKNIAGSVTTELDELLKLEAEQGLQEELRTLGGSLLTIFCC